MPGAGHGVPLRCERFVPPAADLGFDLIKRQQLQFPFSRRRIRPDHHFLLDAREAGHLDFNRPFSIRQVGKRIEALLVGDGDKLLAALSGCYRRSGNRQAAESDLPVVFGEARYTTKTPRHQEKPDTENQKSKKFHHRGQRDHRDKAEKETVA